MIIRGANNIFRNRVLNLKSSINNFPGEYGDNPIADKSAELHLEASENGSSKHEYDLTLSLLDL
ncbi:MAG: hypothetical protein IKX40_07770 [Thermoguttaceae bacterium]|nr:hypothetical protein [Thermoguttaceae bacterium]